MLHRLLAFLLVTSANCFSAQSPFLIKDAHIPPACIALGNIKFCTTRSLVDGSLKSELIKKLGSIFEVDTFIETGTYLGDTTIIAAEIFQEVHTIELSHELFLRAFKRLSSHENVTVHFGSSDQVLNRILPNAQGRILFYLDGHYSGHVTARGPLNTPVLQELLAIKNSGQTNSILLIDDIRLFQHSSLPLKTQSLHLGLDTYPDLGELIHAILQINPAYQFCFLGDALLAFPKTPGLCGSPVVRACALQRLEDLCVDLSNEELKEAASIIGKASLDEKEELSIYYRTYSPFELEYGYRSYGCLWYAFILREHGAKEEAELLFKEATKHHKSGWRSSQCID